MKATVVQLKKKVITRVVSANTGTDLSHLNPYWMNKKHIDYLRQSLEQVILDGEENPDKQFTATDKQKASLKNWIDGLAAKYL